MTFRKDWRHEEDDALAALTRSVESLRDEIRSMMSQLDVDVAALTAAVTAVVTEFQTLQAQIAAGASPTDLTGIESAVTALQALVPAPAPTGTEAPPASA